MIEPKNIKLIWERASLYGEMGDNKRAIDSYEQILKVNYMLLLSMSHGCMDSSMDCSYNIPILAVTSSKCWLQICRDHQGAGYSE